MRKGDGKGSVRLISSVAALISLMARRVFNKSAPTCAGLSWTRPPSPLRRYISVPNYLGAGRSGRCAGNQAPMVWLSSEGTRGRPAKAHALRVLKEGVAGTAMSPWEIQLSQAPQEAVVAYVDSLYERPVQ
jgi:hypothetical protein